MTNPHPNSPTATTPPAPRGRRFPGTDWPVWLLLGLVALGLPRTILADLGVVEPNGSWVYYVLALTPFAVWFAAAWYHRSRKPVIDQLAVGLLYGLSLIAVHEALWAEGSSLGHHPPQAALTLSGQFGSPLREVVLHGYTWLIALAIGLGTAAIAAVVAVVAHRVRPPR